MFGPDGAAATPSLPGFDAEGSEGWFRKSTGQGTGTILKADFMNDLWGNLKTFLEFVGVSRRKGHLFDLRDSVMGAAIMANGGRPLGKLQRISNSVMHMTAPMRLSNPMVYFDGKFLALSDPFVWDFDAPGVFEGTENPDEPVYLYVDLTVDPVVGQENSAAARASHTAPQLTGKPGFHPNGSWLCVGTHLNDAGSNLIASDYVNGELEFHQATSSTIIDLTSAGIQASAWQDLSLAAVVPEGATRVHFLSQVRGDSIQIGYGRSDAPTFGAAAEALGSAGLEGLQGAAGFQQLGLIGGQEFQEDSYTIDRLSMSIADPAAPAIRWAHILAGAQQDAHILQIKGYRDPFGPIGE